jgi:O-antigen/teichoic acid export membrane protein
VLGERFRPALLPFSILLLACGSALVWQIAYHPLVVAYKWTWLHPCVQVPAGLVNLGLDFLLIPRLGLEGCAWATVIANVTCSGLYVVYTRRRLGVRRAWNSMLALAPLPVTLAGFAYGQAPLVGLLGLAGVCLVTVKSLGLFRREDLALLAQLPLPERLKRLLPRAAGETP